MPSSVYITLHFSMPLKQYRATLWVILTGRLCRHYAVQASAAHTPSHRRPKAFRKTGEKPHEFQFHIPPPTLEPSRHTSL